MSLNIFKFQLLNSILFLKTIFHPHKNERTNDFLVGTGFTVDKEIRSVKGFHENSATTLWFSLKFPAKPPDWSGCIIKILCIRKWFSPLVDWDDELKWRVLCIDGCMPEMNQHWWETLEIGVACQVRCRSECPRQSRHPALLHQSSTRQDKAGKASGNCLTC